MDPTTLIVTALAAGAGSGLEDTTSSAIKDAYASLKALVRKRLAGNRDGELALVRLEESPGTWAGPLAAELTAAGADSDTDLVAVAQALLNLADEAGSRAGKYAIDARGSQGMQVGDRNTQHNTFNAPPAAEAAP
jgi:hypothetical protein